MEKQNKNVPPLRFKGFDDEWEESQLKDIADYASSGVRSCDISENGKYCLFDANGIIGKIDTYASNNPYISIIKDGSGVGRTRLLPAYTNCLGTMGCIKEKEGNDIDFLFSFLQTIDFSEHIISGAIPHVYFKDYGENLVPHPSIDEQQKIGSFFKELDELIQAKEEELVKLRQLKGALLDAMFPNSDTTNVNGGGGMLNNISNIYPQLEIQPYTQNIPRLRFQGYKEEWKKYMLGDLGTTYSGLSGVSKINFGHGKVHYITYMNVFSHTVASIEELDKVEINSPQNEVRKGDILFTTSSETPDEVGMASVWLYDIPNVYLNSFCFGFRPSEDIDDYFSGYLMRSPKIRDNFTFLAQGISRFNISKQKAMKISTDIPHYDEQKKIGSFFKEIDEEIQTKEEKLIKLSKMKSALLDAMFPNKS